MSYSVRADNLGSFLRPRYLLDAREQNLPREQLREVEDRAIVEVLQLQEEIGLPVVTDGEFRRRFFFSTIEVLFDGIDPMGFTRHHMDKDGVQHALQTPTPVSRLSRRATLLEEELAFTQAHTSSRTKVTLPAPSMFPMYWKDGVSDRAYADRDEYLDHLVTLMNEDAKMLAAAGVYEIQLDAPHYAYIQKVLPGVTDRDKTLEKLIGFDNRVLDGVEGVVTSIHICRGNDRSRFTGTEPYDELAKSIFPRVRATRLLLEYDDERSGGFEPLRWARDDQTVVLGLLTTKRSAMEPESEIRQRIEEASRYVPLERLALSTQCGFSSNAVGNDITVEAQREKLELVVRVATDVWGAA